MRKVHLMYMPIVIFMISLMVACKDDNKLDSGQFGIDKITGIVDRNTTISTANLLDFILVHGSGFDGITKITINDIELNLKEVHITPQVVSLRIPRLLPEEINNKLILHIGDKKKEFDLTVNIPPLKVDGIYNEFPGAGERLVVVGDFFDLYGIDKQNAKAYFGDTQTEVIEASENRIVLDIPQNVPAGSVVRLVSPLVDVKVPGKFREEGLMLYNATDNLGWGGGGGKGTIITGDSPRKPINGNYIQIKLSAAETGWVGEAIAIGGISYTQDILNNPDKYMLKFEINTIKPVKQRPLIIGLGGCEWYDWSAFAAGGAVDTNKEWRTISVNLRKVFNDPATGDIKLPPLHGGMVQIFPLTWVTEDVDLCFDNLRIVPID